MSFGPYSDQGVTSGFSPNPLTLTSSVDGQQLQNAQDDYGYQLQARQRQTANLDQLQAQANGTAPSLAQQLYRNSLNSGVSNFAGALAGNRSLNPALSASLISQQAGNAFTNSAGQAAALRLQEQQQAQQAYQNAINGQRAQDIGSQGQQFQGFSSYGNVVNGQNANRINNQQGADRINAQTAEFNAQQQQAQQNKNGDFWSGLISGATNAVGGIAANAVKPPALAAGGRVPQMARFAGNYMTGGPIPGQANVPGDSYNNDNRMIRVSPGEGVIKRTDMESPVKAARAAAEMAGGSATPADKKASMMFIKALRDRHSGAMADGGEVESPEEDDAEEAAEEKQGVKMMKMMKDISSRLAKLEKAKSRMAA